MKEITTNHPGKTSKKAPSEDQKKGVSGKDDTDEEDLPKIFTYDEIDRLLLAIDDVEDLIACRLMLFAGLRISEVCSLRTKDLLLDPPSVFVLQGKGGKDRYAPIDIHTLSLARSYAKQQNRDPDQSLLELTERTLQRHMVIYFAKIDIPDATCHWCRHTCATWQLDLNIPLPNVQSNLGHKDIATTQIYLHMDIRKRSRSYREATRFGA